MSYTLIRENNLQDSVYGALSQVLFSGKEIIGKFNTQSKTKELHPCCIEITDPTRRTILMPKRGNNPFSTLAETLWILAGRNDVEWLSHFIPRAIDFSDDGKVWRAGYGPRIMEWEGLYDEALGDYKSSNQLDFVIKQLSNDPNSRQAIISLWNPALENTVEKTKDFPCCNWIHFMIRDNALDINVIIRSNDIIWGYSSINMYEWSVIQEIVAKALNVKVGTYYQMSDSFHIYEHHFEKANEICGSAIAYKNFNELPRFEFMKANSNTTFINSNLSLTHYLSQVQSVVDQLEVGGTPQLMWDYHDLCFAYILLGMYKKNFVNGCKDPLPFSDYDNIMGLIPQSDLKVACDYWYQKNIMHIRDKGLETIKECIERCKG